MEGCILPERSRQCNSIDSGILGSTFSGFAPNQSGTIPGKLLYTFPGIALLIYAVRNGKPFDTFLGIALLDRRVLNVAGEACLDRVAGRHHRVFVGSQFSPFVADLANDRHLCPDRFAGDR